jgi:hypothetical protein
MNAINLKKLAAGLAAAGLLFAGNAAAESGFNTTTPTSTVAARVDFRIVIPQFLQFQVGTAGGTIDQITFSPLAANVGNAVAQAGAGGDQGGGAVSVVARGNGGNITITPTNNSAGAGLGTGTVADGFISYAEITTATSAGTGGGINAPTLSNAGGTTVVLVPPSGRVNNRTATWTYSYANTTTPSAGTFGTSGGQVTYTATMP